MDDKDIYRAAQELIKQFEEDALLIAMKRTEGFSNQEEAGEAYYWNEICNAIEFLTLPTELSSETIQ